MQCGRDEFMQCVETAEKEYKDSYLPFLECQRENMAARREKQVAERLAQFERSLDSSKTGGNGGGDGGGNGVGVNSPSDLLASIAENDLAEQLAGVEMEEEGGD